MFPFILFLWHDCRVWKLCHEDRIDPENGLSFWERFGSLLFHSGPSSLKQDAKRTPSQSMLSLVRNSSPIPVRTSRRESLLVESSILYHVLFDTTPTQRTVPMDAFVFSLAFPGRILYTCCPAVDPSLVGTLTEGWIHSGSVKR